MSATLSTPAAVTVILHEAFFPLGDAAVTVALPLRRAVTTPSSTQTTDTSELVHCRVISEAAAGRTAGESVSDSPAFSAAAVRSSVTLSTSAGLISNAQEALLPLTSMA